MENIVVSGGQAPGWWSKSGNWQSGIALGNGSWGNNYDHLGYGVSVDSCYYGYNVNVSSLGLFGAQPAANAIDFNVIPGAQCTFENIQSQNSNQLFTSVTGSSSLPISFRDVLFAGWTGSGYSKTWAYVHAASVALVFQNVICSTGASRIMSFDAGSNNIYKLCVVLINVLQPNTPSAGILAGTGTGLLVMSYGDTSAGGGPNVVNHAMFALQGAWLSTGAAVTSARPAASRAGAGAMWFDTTLRKPIWSDGTAWRDATGKAA
jgi:hypothetical protein